MTATTEAPAKPRAKTARERADEFVVGSPYTRRSAWETDFEVWRVESSGVKKDRKDGREFVKVTFKNVSDNILTTAAESDAEFHDFVKLTVTE